MAFLDGKKQYMGYWPRNNKYIYNINGVARPNKCIYGNIAQYIYWAITI